MTQKENAVPVEDGGALPDYVMHKVPRGAFALALLTAGLLVAAWFAVFLLVFLPRGLVA